MNSALSRLTAEQLAPLGNVTSAQRTALLILDKGPAVYCMAARAFVSGKGVVPAAFIHLTCAKALAARQWATIRLIGEGPEAIQQLEITPPGAWRARSIKRAEAAKAAERREQAKGASK